MTSLRKLVRAAQWCADRLEGDMIEVRDYRRSYLGYPEVSQKELEAITRGLNAFFAHLDSPERIRDSMGEIIAYRDEQRCLDLRRAR